MVYRHTAVQRFRRARQSEPCYHAWEVSPLARQKLRLRLVKGHTRFSSIRRYSVRRGSVEELSRRVQEGFVPLVRQMKGFGGYYLINGGPDVLITISVFDSADEAIASNEKAADWVRNNVLEATRGLPEVMVGDVLIAEVK